MTHPSTSVSARFPKHLRGFVLANVAAVLCIACGWLVAGAGGCFFAFAGVVTGIVLRAEAEEAADPSAP